MNTYGARRVGWLLALVCVSVALSGCATGPRIDVPRQDSAITIDRAGQRIAVHKSQELQPRDEIETGPDSVAVIRFPTGDEVLVDSHTRVRLGSVDVVFGHVFARVKGLFSVRSENVVAGVRGTSFEFAVAPDRAVSVTVMDGTVVCSSKTESWPSLRLGAAETLVSPYPNQVPPRTGPAAPAELERIREWVRRVDAICPPGMGVRISIPIPIPIPIPFFPTRYHR